MNDKELRDKLADEYWDSLNTGIPVSAHATTIFKAGWDAARANDETLRQAAGYELEPGRRLGFVVKGVPPELREGIGEIETAEQGELPRLVEAGDLRGAFHNHTTASDGRNTLAEMVAAAEALGWEYLGIADHSKASFQANGLSEERLLAQVKEIQELNASQRFKTHVFAGTECDILADGRLDFPADVLAQLDYTVVSVHNPSERSDTSSSRTVDSQSRFSVLFNPTSMMSARLCRPTRVSTGSPDYVMLAEAYGGNGFVVNDVAELKKAAHVALNSKRFTLIEARINPLEYQTQM